MNIKKTTEKWTVLVAALAIAGLLAVAAFAQSGSTFRFFGPLSRVITPNGDSSKNNGTAIFCFDNPADSGVSGNIFSLLGGAVATLGPSTPNPTGSGCPTGSLGSLGEYLSWDGRSNGIVVRSGVYVYRIAAEQHSYTGTIIVVR